MDACLLPIHDRDSNYLTHSLALMLRFASQLVSLATLLVIGSVFQPGTALLAQAPRNEASVKQTAPPNVLFILTDDQSWDSFGFLGGNAHTPRLNQMAREGLYLSNFNVTSTVCSPSRYSFLTGRFAGRCEGDRFLREHPPGDQTQVENIGELESHRWNLPKVLQANGYRTGFVGKSHVVRHDWLHTNRNEETAGRMGWEQGDDPRDPTINELMRQNHRTWCDEIQKHGFDYADGIYAANLKELHNDALNVHNLDWTISKAYEFLDARDERPFFLCVSTTLHHGPAPWVNRFSLDADPRMTGEGFVERGFDVLPPRSDVLRRNQKAGHRPADAYALWLDDGVGALLDKLRDLKLDENTLVVFAPDHGSYRHGKATLYEYGMRVPALCVWPGTIPARSQYDGIVANIDFAPTILEVCGIDPPVDYKFDGVSFRSVLEGQEQPIRDVLFGELGHSRCVKTEDWKYVAIRYPAEIQGKIDRGETFRAFQNNPPLSRPYLTRNGHLGHHASEANPHYFEANQLYNLKEDPEETKNVYDQHPATAARMQRLLAKELARFDNRPFGEFTGTTFQQTLKPLPVNNKVDVSTLHGKVMVGYQGWFNTPNDGMELGWKHWSRSANQPIDADNITVDLWPDVSEYPAETRVDTSISHEDGATAQVFSSANPDVVDVHFRWMNQHGIDGAFVQRFANQLKDPKRRQNVDRVLDNVQAACQRHGRTYSIMYDLSGMRGGTLSLVLDDWKRLREELSHDGQYLQHRSKPLVAVWGIGFSDDRDYSLTESQRLIRQLKAAGASVLLGVPSYWRTGQRDALDDERLHDVLKLADVLCPWTIGRYQAPKSAQRHADKVWNADLEWCQANQLDFMPVVYPGFSWHNLHGDPLDSIPRRQGDFFWSQIEAAHQLGCNMLYVAMFDEVDEATAIFKCTNHPPTSDGVKLLDYDNLPHDHYLRLTGRAAELFRNRKEVKSTPQ